MARPLGAGYRLQGAPFHRPGGSARIPSNSRLSLQVPILDTVIVKDRQITRWFFWSKIEGRILKKAQKNLLCRRVNESFGRRKGAEFCSAYLLEFESKRQGKAGARSPSGVPRSDRPRSPASLLQVVSSRYFDKDQLEECMGIHDEEPFFLEDLLNRRSTVEVAVQGPDRRSSDSIFFPDQGIFQRFIYPPAIHGVERNHVIRVRVLRVLGPGPDASHCFSGTGVCTDCTLHYLTHRASPHDCLVSLTTRPPIPVRFAGPVGPV